MNPVPFTWMLLAMLLIAGVSAGTGWHYGGKVVKADWAAESIAVAVKAADDAQKVVDADARADKATASKRAALAVKKQTVTEKVIVHVQTLPDPAECALAPERVSNINDAFGLAADPRGKAAAVPGAVSTQERESQRSGELGGGSGVQVPAVQRSAERVGRGSADAPVD